MNKLKYVIIILFLFLSTFVFSVEANFPEFPMTFYGSVEYNDLPAPVGSKIRAIVNGDVVGEIEVKKQGEYGTFLSTGLNLSIKKYNGNNINFYYIKPNTNELVEDISPINLKTDFVAGKIINFDFNFKSNEKINKPKSSGGGGGGGVSKINYCSFVEYGPWKNCVNGVQTRSIINFIPTSCIPTALQKESLTKNCINNEVKEIKEEKLIDNINKSNNKNIENISNSNNEKSNNDLLRESVLNREKKRQSQKINNDLTNRLSGYILLQVEENGEAWYVEPIKKEKHFLGRPSDAFFMMRNFGLGISEINFENFLENGVPNKFAGRIFLRVEKKGEGYYVNPDNLNMYYLGRPSDAFNIMRELSLGVTNGDISQIPLSE